MASHFRLSPLLLAVVMLAGFVAYLYWPQTANKNQRQESVTPVTVHTVHEQPFAVIIEALGTAKANESVSITAQKSDIVQSLAFDDGQMVEQGQLLLQLRDREERSRVNELEVNLKEAQRQLKRITNLRRESVASEQLLDEQQAKVNALEAQLDVALAQLKELEIRAPFSGLLGIRQVSIGALVSPGDVITTLDDIHRIKVDFSIAESHLPSVAPGQQVKARSVAYPGELFEGTISSIDSRVDPVTRAINVRALVDNPDNKLRPGMLLQIDLRKAVLNTLVVPEAALIPVEDHQFVFVVDGDRVSRKAVEVGRRKPGEAQIVSGLKEGDQVVVEGALRLRDGAKVNVLNAQEG
ncbi:efflux RND transporter periplasmic adaptor subunit [Aestuariibacter halophilus]|uniref:Efflux RND transporter periplasmic adaptor subunit n=1 Tax=Fluctibacter halophilus TaxID=226011 RepID=A0ABS8G7F2_9ALTE|nr:efflux RND transporter periplasmic adaptor subunit [Aestuariibacter halophilus]MCC2616414.1 efflux RND transporter periplasmic adaptor subunit [Aestuariibacter halophilus]